MPLNWALSPKSNNPGPKPQVQTLNPKSFTSPEDSIIVAADGPSGASQAAPCLSLGLGLEGFRVLRV